MAGLGVYHLVHRCRTGRSLERPREHAQRSFRAFAETLVDFVRKPKIVGMLLFVFLYRSGEGFLLVEAPLFMQAPLATGGLGLSLADKALIDGAISTGVSLLAGVCRRHVRRQVRPQEVSLFMALCMNIPHLCFVYLSHAVTPDDAAVARPRSARW